jgi:pyruvate dehydrogenase E1 component alpha subunit
MFDPERYRDKAEVERWRERDPIDLLLARLDLPDDELAAIEEEIRVEIEDAVDYAENSPDEDVADLMRFVYSPSSTVVRGLS